MYNEVYTKSKIRVSYRDVMKWANSLPKNTLIKKKTEAENLFRKIGITFSVYNNYDASERLLPFDLFPRVITHNEWSKISKGVIQRSLAINAFLHDIYHSGEIMKTKIIPRHLVYGNPAYEIKMVDFKVPNNIYSPIIGTDIIRTNENKFLILEDNCRTPSGVSYMIENREIMMRMFPELFQAMKIEPVENYPNHLLDTLTKLRPKNCSDKPNIVILTPGPLNSAYYEHSFLANMMGIELVQGSDLYVEKNITYMKTTRGKEKVDIIYRRIDDHYIDPITFDNNSLIGVPGLFDSYKSGNINICSAPGSGIADDKAIYTYLPDIIKFYLSEEPILENVKTYKCFDVKDRGYVLKNLNKLVVKEVHGSGGYGMLIGNAASKTKIENFKRKIKSNPGNFIAQPIISLSSVPIFSKNILSPRHVDLRPYCLISNKKITLVSGALTRVALKENSLVVNSSQGGGVKDTWILAE